MSYKSVLELSSSEARDFFLDSGSYFNNDLPEYFNFNDLLKKVYAYTSVMEKSNLIERAKKCEDINHEIHCNKDGKYAWRPLQLIHPALYVSLVKNITEVESWEKIQDAFSTFSSLDKTECISIPIKSTGKYTNTGEQVLDWWNRIEQRSLELALDWEYLIHADIQNCYGEIYTHSVSWALHGRDEAKRKRFDKNLIGNIIDNHLQAMHFGQTNGIPQGSILMDFIAEMVLGSCDRELAKELESEGINDYHILRYRDDYRIFVRNSQNGGKVLKHLSEVLNSYGLKLSANKTSGSDQVVATSVKRDKMAWFCKKNSEKNIQKYLLLIHAHSLEFPNSGSLMRALSEYYRVILGALKPESKIWIGSPKVLISITTDIAFKNPKTYPICAAILSNLLNIPAERSFNDEAVNKRAVLESINSRFKQIPNTGFMDIWLQRISLKYGIDFNYKEKLCNIADGKKHTNNEEIWDCAWINSWEDMKGYKKRKNLNKLEKEEMLKELRDMIKLIIETPIFHQEALDKLEPNMIPKEVELFHYEQHSL